ncbi:MAG: sensor histidine kinase [Acidobacteria bacterium]|nr:sensor histidine kinase [Acidobacteriota bacterium]
MTALPAGIRTTRRRVHTRVFALVFMGMAGALAIVAVADWMSWRSLAHKVAADRRGLAGLMATGLDHAFGADLELLQTVAAAPHLDLRDGDHAAEAAAVKAAHLRAHLVDAIVVARLDGTVVAEEARAASRKELSFDPSEVTRAFEQGRPALIIDASAALMWLMLPVRRPPSGYDGLVAGRIDLHGAVLAGLLGSGSGDAYDAARIVDARGRVISAFGTPPEPGIAEEAFVGSPLVTLPLRLEIRPAESDVAAPIDFLWTSMVLVPVIFGVTLLFAWGAARSVTVPVERLRLAAERVAAGDLVTAVPPVGNDEIGRLGRAVEHMRAALADSVAGLVEAKRDLERRVEDRTRELQALYGELRERDAVRAQLLRKVISAQEEERKRIARELHDETTQTLTALTMRLDASATGFPAESSLQRLKEARGLAGRALDEVHRLIHALRPSVLDDLGLLAAIRWFAERHLQPLGIAVRCEFVDGTARLNPTVETAVFRVVQEALTNVARHAGADTVLIQAGETDGRFLIEIEDDGCGFEPAAYRHGPGDGPRGLGLLGLRERIEFVGGRLWIDSAPGQGTHVKVEVPADIETDHEHSNPDR